MLTMGGRTMLNIRDFRRYFSPADALRQHRAFAAFAVRTLSRTDDCSRVMSMLFALASMQMDGRIDRWNPGMLPHLRVPYQTMRALLDAPVPTPDKACEHMRKLVSCFAQEEQTALLVPMRTSRAAAELAAQCGLMEARKKILFLMVVSACRLADAMWSRVAITPQAAEAALTDCTEEEQEWVKMPCTGDLLLEERGEPWRVLVHPAWCCEPAARTLPEGTRLGTARICALAHAHGSKMHQAVVQFFRDKKDEEPCAEVVLRAGEYVTVTVLRDADGCMPLPPRPDMVENGRHVLNRPGKASDTLHLNGKPVPAPSGRLTGFAPDDGGGYVLLVDGLLEDSAFTRRAFLHDFLLDVQGERFVDVAMRGSELALLCHDGHVLSSYDYLHTERPVMTLDDYFA